MTLRKILLLPVAVCALGALLVVGHAQNNSGGKGSGGGGTAPSTSGVTDSLTMSQSNIETGGTEVALAVVKNTGASSAVFKIDTQLYGPDSNGGSIEEQTNTITLNAGQSFTQNMTATPSAAGQYTVISTFSVNGVAADFKTGTFNAFSF